ncbi:MAG: phage major capsid protein [Thermodesulfobacteriota bacterium]|nr:phage major capsid protein [Thermodesulfobacteriota bacterium]
MKKNEAMELIRKTVQKCIRDGNDDKINPILSDRIEHPLDVGNKAVSIGGPAVDKSYRGMFYPEQETGIAFDDGGWKDINDYFNTIYSGLSDKRLEAMVTKSTHVEGDAELGGFSVPETFAEWLMDKALESEIVRPRATVWPMKTPTRKVPKVLDYDHSSKVNNMWLQWMGEGSTGTNQNIKLERLTLSARKAGIFAKSSNEILEDGMGFKDQLGVAMSSALSFGLDYTFFNGTGAGQPLGIFNASCKIEVAKEVGQAANSVVLENLLKLFARQLDRQNAVWVVNSTTIPSIMTVSVVIGTSGSHYPVMNESNGKFSIFGRPVIFSEKVPALSSAADVGFYSFRHYAIGIRKGMALEKSTHLHFQTDESVWRLITRLDGQPTLSEAVTPRNGDTLSPFVTLAARP